MVDTQDEDGPVDKEDIVEALVAEFEGVVGKECCKLVVQDI